MKYEVHEPREAEFAPRLLAASPLDASLCIIPVLREDCLERGTGLTCNDNGPWSFLQSHPFVVISWAEKPQDHLDLFIEPRRSLTRELLYHAKNGHAMNPLVLFSGPHGKSIPMDDCENILIVVSGFGIAAHLPYLKQLIHRYNAREVRTR